MIFACPNPFCIGASVLWYNKANSLHARDKIWKSKFPWKLRSINTHVSKGHTDLWYTCRASTSNETQPSVPEHHCWCWLTLQVLDALEEWECPFKGQRKRNLSKTCRLAIWPSFGGRNFFGLSRTFQHTATLFPKSCKIAAYHDILSIHCFSKKVWQ